MSVSNRIVAAFNGFLPIGADVYKGEANTYLVYNYTEIPADFGDDDAQHYINLVQVHLFAPHNVNTVALRREISSRLVAAGFIRPAITNASDKDGQHYILESEDAEGV